MNPQIKVKDSYMDETTIDFLSKKKIIPINDTEHSKPKGPKLKNNTPARARTKRSKSYLAVTLIRWKIGTF